MGGGGGHKIEERWPQCKEVRGKLERREETQKVSNWKGGEPVRRIQGRIKLNKRIKDLHVGPNAVAPRSKRRGKTS